MATLVAAEQISRIAPSRSASNRKHSLLVRLMRAVFEARQRQVDRDIAEILARRGGIMKDALDGSRAGQSRAYPFRAWPAVRPE